MIDGYNLLRSIPETSDVFHSITDFQMCLIIDKYLALSRQKGRIVFDGIGPNDKSGFAGTRRLEVLFAGRAVEADKVIEDIIKSNTSPKTLAVISNDRRIKKAARARKAASVESEVFWRQVQRFLSKKTDIGEPDGKRKGVSEAETEQWLRFFELDKS